MSEVEILNLDVLATGTIPITKTLDGELRRWELKDNVSTTVMLYGMAFAQLAEKLQAAAQAVSEDDPDSFERLQAEMRRLEERALVVCTEIFRNTFPHMTREEVAATFSHEERMAIVQRFIFRRSSESSLPPSGGDQARPASVAAARTPPARRSVRKR